MNRLDVTHLLAACLPTQLALLGYIEALGPLDAYALSQALQMPASGARRSADALVAMGLLVLEWFDRKPAYALSPFVGRETNSATSTPVQAQRSADRVTPTATPNALEETR